MNSTNFPQHALRVPRPTLPGQINFSLVSLVRQCPVCGYSSNRLTNFRRHLRKKHGFTDPAIQATLDEQDRSVLEEREQEETNLDSAVEDVEDVPADVDVADDVDVDVAGVDSLDAGDDYTELLGIDYFEKCTSFFESNIMFIEILGGYTSVSSDEEENMFEEELDDFQIQMEEHVNWNRNTTDCHPFPDLQSLVLLALVDGDNDLMSRRVLKKILHAINLILVLKDRALQSNATFKLPSLNSLLKFQNNKKNEIPKFRSVEVNVEASPTELIPATVNLPSEHLKLLMANPLQSTKICSIPDRTVNQSICLQQGRKWQTHPLFQHPMYTVDGIDYWFGDLVYLWDLPMEQRFLIESFHSNEGQVYMKGYISAEVQGNPFVMISTEETYFSVNRGMFKCTYSYDLDVCLSYSDGVTYPLAEKHRAVLSKNHRHKWQKTGAAGEFYKVRIAPLILFTDDVSGNSTKQYNAYESWSMRCGALPFEERLSTENTS